MKRTLSLVLSLLLAVAILAGCGTSGSTSTTTQATTQATTAGTTAAPQAEDTVKTGLGIVTTMANSKDAGEKDGVAEAYSMIAAVTVDKDGKIVKCVLDAAQTKINFSKEGKLLSDLKTVYKTKNELGDEYGMRKNSKIGKEWNEQAEAFAKYVVGKTIAEVKGIALDAEGRATDAELTSSVTVHVNDLIAAVEKAVANAQDIGAKASDKLGLATTTNIEKSKDAGENDGLAQAYSTFTATTFDASGKITSCVIDASQANINFSKAGKITTDLATVFKTKNELGNDYGMKKNSKIGKEWFEQAAAYAKYVAGKTVAEVKGTAVNAEGVPTQAELTSSVSIHIADFNTIIEKAAASAK